ncbi:unnamed protein product [Callosobruchus maculatus]|uniref:Uncharacterized protein n=1 Tax=Callosobruchus maculatus TaxID=64391 RepID=A0A653DUY1_CALMS|nr:unnamed protein product [Callosobruchus maculatus]
MFVIIAVCTSFVYWMLWTAYFGDYYLICIFSVFGSLVIVNLSKP